MSENKTIWTKKDLLGLQELSKEEIQLILDTAGSFKEVSTREIKKVPALRGKTVVNLFYEPSTRTRISFEVAAKRLSADVINIAAETSSVKKGETIIDTGTNIQALKADIIVIRHNSSGSAALLSRYVDISVINAGDGWHEHPTQALLDIFTLKEKLGKIKGLSVVIVGDIAHSRVARSNIWGLTKLGAKVTVCAPPMLIPPGIEQMGASTSHDINEALKNADAVNVLRMQFERDTRGAFPDAHEYFRKFGITKERLEEAKKKIVVMHPGPLNRGIEISSEVADGVDSVILEQVTNGIAVRMAVLFLSLARKRKIMKLLIKNGHVVDPVNKIDEVRDILIKDSKISKVAKNIKEKADKIIDATDKIVLPGLVDMHVHLREPGREDKETVASGTKAALKGGITSILAMPNTQPAMDSADNIKLLKTIIKKTAQANVFIAGTITFSRLGKELTDVGILKKEGAIAITDDGSSLDEENLLLQALKDVKKETILLISHCEDKSLSNNGEVNLGLISTILGLRGIPKESEYKIVERDIKLADKAGSSIHIAHVSCKESVDTIAKAKKKGIKVTAETAPHYFALDEESLLTYDTNLKINPPIRTKDDAKAIKQGLKSGIIDCIASDHAPHTRPEKEVAFEEAAFGTIGLETALSVAITELIDTKVLTWTQLVERMSLSPAKILGIDKGTLSVAKDADIVIVDPDKEWDVNQDCFESKSKNSAFLGRKLKGVVAYTICAGKVAYKSS